MHLLDRSRGARTGFTLVEILVVAAIIAVLSAIIGDALYAAKAAARKSACAFNLRQMSVGIGMYLVDYDGGFPVTKGHTTVYPQYDDADGSIELPDYGSPLDHLGQDNVGIADCPGDADPGATLCANVPHANPGTQSYLFNGYLVWGMNESLMRSSAETVLLAERRSNPVKTTPPYCDVIVHPWFNPSNPQAPQNDMDPTIGAIATTRHGDGANYLFADNHAKCLAFNEVWSPPYIDDFTP